MTDARERESDVKMTEQSERDPGGRPSLEFSLREVEELARIGCTEEDMAAVLGVSVDTLQRRKRDSEEFCGAVKRGQATTRNSLRRLQLKQALQGNTTMLIWLGKQLLGQSEKQATELTGQSGKAIELQVSDINDEAFITEAVAFALEQARQSRDKLAGGGAPACLPVSTSVDAGAVVGIDAVDSGQTESDNSPAVESDPTETGE
jgi:hypothetical protein